MIIKLCWCTASPQRTSTTDRAVRFTAIDALNAMQCSARARRHASAMGLAHGTHRPGHMRAGFACKGARVVDLAGWGGCGGASPDQIGAPPQNMWSIACLLTSHPPCSPHGAWGADDTIITWTDKDIGTDVALSFQEALGCNAIWCVCSRTGA